MGASWDAKNHHFSAPIWGIGLDFWTQPPKAPKKQIQDSQTEKNLFPPMYLG